MSLIEPISKDILKYFLLNNDLRVYATQPRLCIPIINRIYTKMSVGIIFDAIKVQGNFICDGHHRYIASLFARKPIRIIHWTASRSINSVNWNSIELDEKDWDSLDQINMHNLKDAEFNNITMERLSKMLN